MLFITSHLGSGYGVRLSFYLNSNIFNTAYGFSLGFIERTFTFVLLVLTHYKFYNQNKYSKIFLNLFYLFIYCNLFLGEIYIIPSRVGLMLSFTYVVIWPTLYSLQKLLIKQMMAVTFSFYLVLKMAKQVSINICGWQAKDTLASIYMEGILKYFLHGQKH